MFLPNNINITIWSTLIVVLVLFIGLLIYNHYHFKKDYEHEETVEEKEYKDINFNMTVDN